MTSFDYDLGARLNDDTEVKLDPEQHGWAEPERLAKVVVWALIPRNSNWPAVWVHIPEGAKPVFMSRVFGKGLPIEGGPSFRTYCIGWFKDGETHKTWVLPGGIVEVGDEPTVANMLLNNIGQQIREQREAAERAEQEQHA